MPTIVNPDTGIESTRHTAFSDSTWGNATRSFLATINNKVDDAAMKQIMDDAAAYVKAADGGDLSSGSVDLDELCIHWGLTKIGMQFPILLEFFFASKMLMSSMWRPGWHN